MKQTLLRSILVGILTVGVAVTFSRPAQAQGQLDFVVGVSTITAPSASEATGNHFPQSLTGGVYPSFSADFLLFKNFGVQGELAWKGGRGDVQGVPYRPFFYDFNAMYQPKLGNQANLELLAGIGAQSTRFYSDIQVCDPISCRNFVTVNHFMGHFGAGLKLYPSAHSGFFVRPEAHLYLVQDNQEFSSARAVRYGISIGYTLGRK